MITTIVSLTWFLDTLYVFDYLCAMQDLTCEMDMMTRSRSLASTLFCTSQLCNNLNMLILCKFANLILPAKKGHRILNKGKEK